ncbi:MAG TPA: hypothetical protein VF527_20790 [Pyrinomonadaceae bacterium]|jgi:hypothetical protein
MGTGYIRVWDEDTFAGMIRVCDSGGVLGDDEEAVFSLSTCSDKTLKAKLRKSNSFNLARRCNPEPLQDSIKVKFDITVDGGGLLAMNVEER